METERGEQVRKAVRITPELLKEVLDEHQKDSDDLVQKILDLYNENGGWAIESFLPIIDFLRKFSDGAEEVIGIYQLFIVGVSVGENIEKLRKLRAEQQRALAEIDKKNEGRGGGNPPAGGSN